MVMRINLFPEPLFEKLPWVSNLDDLRVSRDNSASWGYGLALKTLTDSSSFCWYDVKVKPNVRYVFSAVIVAVGGSHRYDMPVSIHDGSAGENIAAIKSVSGTNTLSCAFTAPSSGLIRIRMRGNSAVDGLANIWQPQLELESTYTTSTAWGVASSPTPVCHWKCECACCHHDWQVTA